MTAIVVCCHAKLASAFVETAALILGEKKQLYAVDFPADQRPEALTEAIVGVIEASGAERVLVLTDLYGASPANAAAAALLRVLAETTILSGVNLAAVLEAALSAETADTLCALAERVRAAAQAGIRPVTRRMLESAMGSNA